MTDAQTRLTELVEKWRREADDNDLVIGRLEAEEAYEAAAAYRSSAQRARSDADALAALLAVPQAETPQPCDLCKLYRIRVQELEDALAASREPQPTEPRCVRCGWLMHAPETHCPNPDCAASREQPSEPK